MAVCTCHGKKEWMRLFVTQSALLDEHCMSVLQKAYNDGSSSIKSCTSRGPKGIESSYGVLDPIEADGIYPKRCYLADQYPNAIQNVTLRIPNRAVTGSGISSCYDTRKPPIRKRTSLGVYVGNYQSVPIKRVTHRMPWNSDTTIPRGCKFLHCQLIHMRRVPGDD